MLLLVLGRCGAQVGELLAEGDVAVAVAEAMLFGMQAWTMDKDVRAKMYNPDTHTFNYGYEGNYLLHRETRLEHIADVRNHKYLISGDSLPMHIALGSGIKCLSIFICTSPWEIYDHNLQKKIVSPNLEKYFYRREFLDTP